MLWFSETGPFGGHQSLQLRWQVIGMMLIYHEHDVNPLYVIKYQQFQKCDAVNYQSCDFTFILIPTTSTPTVAMNMDRRMLHTIQDHKSADYFGKEIPFFISTERMATAANPFDFQKNALENNFEDIFCGNFAPNFSTISISTRSNRSYDNFDISSDFFIDDCLLEQPCLQQEKMICQLSGQKTEKPLTIPEEQKKQIFENQIENIEELKGQSAANCHDETKNIPKNYIKAIFTFILQNAQYLLKLFNRLSPDGENTEEVVSFIEYIKAEKKTKKYTIQRLKALWMEKKHGKAMRIISSQFLRKRSLGYIFGSKIQKKIYHVKYRYKFIRAVENPLEFTNIK